MTGVHLSYCAKIWDEGLWAKIADGNDMHYN